MKKLIKDPLAVVDDMVVGLARADDRFILIEGCNVIVRRDFAQLQEQGKVALISGGGAGHEPAHAGYVGRGMLTAAVAGPVFTSPSVDAILAAIRQVTGPAGSLLIVKNYTGDRLNFGLAAEIARTEGFAVELVTVGDDVALDGGRVGLRGIAGTVFVHKVAGAAAEAGLSLTRVKAEAEEAAANIFSMGIGLSSCSVPAAGKPGFELGENEVEYGLGIHGESGVRRATIETVDVMVESLLARILEKGGITPTDKVALLVNNLGGTAAQELDVVARYALEFLELRGVSAEAAQVGTFLTALEMAGVSLSVMRLDTHRQDRLFAPSDARAWSAPTRPCRGNTLRPIAEIAGSNVAIGHAWPNDACREIFEKAVRSVANALLEHEQELTRLDSIVGDGDIGLSLARGARAITSAMLEMDTRHPAASLYEISARLRAALGGTSGPLYAVLVLKAAARLANALDVTAPKSWGEAFRAGCEGVIALGKGKPGDRTMLDALLPAADAFDAAVAAGLSPSEIVLRIARAAKDGTEATKAMKPALGRSSYVGDRALGHVDPGAYAVTVWLDAIANIAVPA